MKKTVRHIFFLFALLVMLSSCDKKEADSGNMSVLCPIEFGVTGYGAEVKANELTSGNISGFGVFAALEPNDNDFLDNDAQLSVFMDNVLVKKTGSLWQADPVHYWPILQGKKLSFFAYAPYCDQEETLDAVADWDNRTISLAYTLDADPKNQMDLCVANAVLDRRRDADGDGVDDPVEFNFDHTLTWVSFAANYIGDIPEGCTLQIDELTVSNVLNSNTLVGKFVGGALEWKWESPASAVRDGRYVMSRESGIETLGNVPLEHRNQANDNHKDFQTARGYLYALPQTINPAGVSVPATLSLTFSYVRTDGSVIAQFFTEMNLPSEGVWEPGKKVKYIFTIDVTTASLIQLAAVSGGTWVTDWQASGNVHVDKEIR